MARSQSRFSRASLSLLLFALVPLAAAVGCDSAPATPKDPDRVPGQTDFSSDEVPGAGNFGAEGALPGATQDGAARGNAGGTPTSTTAPTVPPSGRMGTVEEADIYRVDKNRLFYLNTYRGFVIYDLNDPKNPKRISRLPVYGYPVEMFVSGNTVYALLREALYLTQTAGKLEFQRHNVSQLVAIDITDLANPKVLKTVDIIGELREGVSRKIDDTVYVVSYIPQYYYWGWRYELDGAAPQKEQAWVYSFNVANPADVKLVEKLQIFEGGSVSAEDPVTGGNVTRSFSNVAISATSNTLMVVENWYLNSWTPGASSKGMYECGSWANDQRAVVSIVDISDPTGDIALHTRFQARGSLGDQFKQTYVYDEASGSATYYGIFARQAWDSSNCQSKFFTQNVLESWDVTDGAAPVRLDTLDFGKQDEVVRGSAFDVDRKVVYAITAQAIDPLYALSFADPRNLTVRSLIDGLSGDMTLFRLVEGNKFLIGIGRDSSQTCSGFQGNETRRGVNMAVSLIDVRDLDAIKLMQRQCVAVENAEWVSSEVAWNLDQAHKMIGMHSDGTTNVITVPVSYYKQTQDSSWWWYHWETAVGLMAWNVAAYDPAKKPAEQTVIQNYGTFLHPNGEVRRSIVFTHQGATAQRMMVNLSDTHISVANLQDLTNPKQEAIVEVAPYVSQLYAFGDHVVERIDESQFGRGQQGLTEFRVKLAGGNAGEAAPVAKFSVSQVVSVIKHGERLVVFRSEQSNAMVVTPKNEVVVFDLTVPAAPKLVGRVTTEAFFYPYYPFYCGLDYGGGYWWWMGDSRWASTKDAIVFLRDVWDNANKRNNVTLSELDLRDPTQPTVHEMVIPVAATTFPLGLQSDVADPSAFFLTMYDAGDQTKRGSVTLTRTRYYAQRWLRASTGWKSEARVNLPGRLLRSWTNGDGVRLYVTADSYGYETKDPQGNLTWRQDTRLHLLRGIVQNGRNVAELRSSHRFQDRYLSDVVISGETLFANVGPAVWYGWAVPGGVGRPTATDVAVGSAALTAEQASRSDRLVAFDLRQVSLDLVYDQPTGTQGMQLMGTHDGLLFANLPGDGLLAINVANPAQPIGRQFLRTLGWASHVAFSGQNAYIGSGYFGVHHMDLTKPGGFTP